MPSGIHSLFSYSRDIHLRPRSALCQTGTCLGCVLDTYSRIYMINTLNLRTVSAGRLRIELDMGFGIQAVTVGSCIQAVPTLFIYFLSLPFYSLQDNAVDLPDQGC